MQERLLNASFEIGAAVLREELSWTQPVRHLRVHALR
jgi:hypothetical protein